MQDWRNELNKLIVILLVAITVGALLGHFYLSIVITLTVYTLFNILQLRKLHHWLYGEGIEDRSPPPESFGLWGSVFDGIYRLQKQERSASAHLENIINKAQESSAALEMAVIMVNKSNNLDWWNQAAEQLLGLQYPRDRHQSVTNLIRDPRFADYFHNEKYDTTLILNAPGDSKRVLEFQIALFGEHERLMIVRDITQLHKLEMMRKDFVGNVSHELGTPITVIKGYLEAILDNLEDPTGKWRKPIEQMQRQSIRMENIVRDLLILSSLETKTPPRTQEKIVCHKLFAEIKHDMAQTFGEKEHTFTIDCASDLVLSGNRSEIYSAISNLVLNAAKYTPANGTIQLTARVINDKLKIEVTDNGIGIESKHIPRLTERFYRVDVSRSTESGGNGLGLAIVKHILARHQAELKISSELGRGSVFSCVFPASKWSRVSEEKSQLETALQAPDRSTEHSD